MMPELPKHSYDESKLPQWAQHELQRLRANVEHWRDKALAGPEESNTFTRHGMNHTPLGLSPTIEFKLEERRSIIARFEPEFGLDSKGHLVIQASGRIHVQPQATNAINIELVD